MIPKDLDSEADMHKAGAAAPAGDAPWYQVQRIAWGERIISYWQGAATGEESALERSGPVLDILWQIRTGGMRPEPRRSIRIRQMEYDLKGETIGVGHQIDEVLANLEIGPAKRRKAAGWEGAARAIIRIFAAIQHDLEITGTVSLTTGPMDGGMDIYSAGFWIGSPDARVPADHVPPALRLAGIAICIQGDIPNAFAESDIPSSASMRAAFAAMRENDIALVRDHLKEATLPSLAEAFEQECRAC